jgi:mono/diheme cytochrome c family protein
MGSTVVHSLAAAAGLALLAGFALSQDVPKAGGRGPEQEMPGQSVTDQRGAATRAFLGLGPEPDKAAAALGAPLFQQNCAFCHGQQARGATGSSLITSDEVLSDDHGEHLLPFLKKGRPEKGMPAFAAMTDAQLTDISEFVHLQVEEVANRGTYQVLNILVGDPDKGYVYVARHCMGCHTAETFAHFAARFRSPEQLQRGWVWPSRPAGAGDSSLAVTATVKMPNGSAIAGRVTKVSDFRIALLDSANQTRIVERKPGVKVSIADPLAPHEEMIQTLTNQDLHDVSAYMETLK